MMEQRLDSSHLILQTSSTPVATEETCSKTHFEVIEIEI